MAATRVQGQIPNEPVEAGLMSTHHEPVWVQGTVQDVKDTDAAQKYEGIEWEKKEYQ
jgi:hypothetical protein